MAERPSYGYYRVVLKVSLEADNEENLAALDDLAFKALNWARKVYPEFRPTLLRQIPAEVVQPALAIVAPTGRTTKIAKAGR